MDNYKLLSDEELNVEYQSVKCLVFAYLYGKSSDKDLEEYYLALRNERSRRNSDGKVQ